MNLQKNYELSLAEAENGDQIRRCVTPRHIASA